MRFVARLGLGVFGLALVAAPAAKAQQPVPEEPNGSRPAVAAASPAAAHHHRGLFASRHCVECQRAWVKKHDGVDIPPPPSLLPPGVVASQVVHNHQQGMACAACEGGAMAVGPVGSYPPGHATMGGPEMAGNYPPGHASVGMPGEDPAPVGVAKSWQGRWSGSKLAASGARPYDPTVMPSSMVPAQTAIDGESSNRPHVISHLLGVGGITRHAREAREQRRREAHASIAYDAPGQPVTELPASAVYGRGH
jgi:hypothetical protein